MIVYKIMSSHIFLHEFQFWCQSVLNTSGNPRTYLDKNSKEHFAAEFLGHLGIEFLVITVCTLSHHLFTVNIWQLCVTYSHATIVISQENNTTQENKYHKLILLFIHQRKNKWTSNNYNARKSEIIITYTENLWKKAYVCFSKKNNQIKFKSACTLIST